MLKRNALLGWQGLVFMGLLLIAGFTMLSWVLDPSAFREKLAEVMLQLGLVVIVGALVRYLVTDAENRRITDQRVRDQKQASTQHDFEKRREILRRMTGAHVKVAHARLLMEAHDSGRTYTEQLRSLMLVRPELEEIAEDLHAAKDLFTDSVQITAAVKAIIAFLNNGTSEYAHFHADVDASSKVGKSLTTIISDLGMTWLARFMAGSDLPEEYNTALEKSKGEMRDQVFGQTADPGTSASR